MAARCAVHVSDPVIRDSRWAVRLPRTACIPFGLLGVVTDDEPHGPGPAVPVPDTTGGDVDLFDLQVPATAAYRPGRASAAVASVLVWRSFSAWM